MEEDKFTIQDAELLREILNMWDEVSNNPKAYRSMTDSCHTEYQFGEILANKIERVAKESQ